MKHVASVLVALALASCSSTAPPEPAPAYPPVTAAPPRSSPPPVAAIQPTRPSRDQCGADALQALVGRPRTEIPVPVQPDRWRVACTTCPVTEDYRPDRLNFL